jgi:hypothetical protein
MEYPPLLSAKHIMHMLSVSRPKAYEIMCEPHRPVWRHGTLKRLHRDLFLAQLEEESKGGMTR